MVVPHTYCSGSAQQKTPVPGDLRAVEVVEKADPLRLPGHLLERGVHSPSALPERGSDTPKEAAFTWVPVACLSSLVEKLSEESNPWQ